LIPGQTNRGFVRCSNCGYPQEGRIYNRPGFTSCPHCRSALNISTFPALYQQPAVSEESRIPVDVNAATCFYHPTRPAAVPCSSCGRYLCTLCEIELGHEKICPNCLDKAARSEEVTELVDSRTLYDSIALTVAVAPVLIWFVTIITAPLSIYMTVRHWKTPISILPRRKWRFILAFIIAVIQILLWSALLFALIS
jgi:hypothetical protein